ncbi:MAG: hypothetical protein LIP12_06130 [Clostridiales bacterium]|nr:hypothetical protein [Clostridiales bacterium]
MQNSTLSTSSSSYIAKLQKEHGLPDKIKTEAHLWDEILKKEILELPFLILPLIREIHGKQYPANVSIEPVGTEYSVECPVTKQISSIRSDTTIKIDHSDIFHFENQRRSDPMMIFRVFEYGSQLALTVAVMGSKVQAENSFLLKFPYSAILLLEGGLKQSNNLTCSLEFPGMKTLEESMLSKTDESKFITRVIHAKYSVALIKVQSYEIQDIYDRQLYILIPFMPIRFSRLAQAGINGTGCSDVSKATQDLVDAKIQLTKFYHDIILILNKATEDGFLSDSDVKIILILLRKAMIRVFYKNSDLLSEVINMTAPVLELEWETIARLEKEVAEMGSALAEKDSALAQKDSALAQKDSALAQKNAEIEKWRALALGKSQTSKRPKRWRR